MEPVAKSIVNRVAKIMGPRSAAQQALDDAERRENAGEAVAFYRSEGAWFVGPILETRN